MASPHEAFVSLVRSCALVHSPQRDVAGMVALLAREAEAAAFIPD